MEELGIPIPVPETLTMCFVAETTVINRELAVYSYRVFNFQLKAYTNHTSIERHKADFIVMPFNFIVSFSAVGTKTPAKVKCISFL